MILSSFMLLLAHHVLILSLSSTVLPAHRFLMLSFPVLLLAHLLMLSLSVLLLALREVSVSASDEHTASKSNYDHTVEIS